MDEKWKAVCSVSTFEIRYRLCRPNTDFCELGLQNGLTSAEANVPFLENPQKHLFLMPSYCKFGYGVTCLNVGNIETYEICIFEQRFDKIYSVFQTGSLCTQVRDIFIILHFFWWPEFVTRAIPAIQACQIIWLKLIITGPNLSYEYLKSETDVNIMSS